MSAEDRVEHQKLNQTTALLLFGWAFGVQLGSLIKNDSPKTLNRDEYDVIYGRPLSEVIFQKDFGRDRVVIYRRSYIYKQQPNRFDIFGYMSINIDKKR